MGKKTIIQIIPVLNLAGAEKLLLKILIGIKPAFPDYRFRILTLVEKGALEKAFVENGFPVDCIPRPGGFSLSRVYQTMQYLKTYEPVVVHTHIPYADRIGLPAAFLSGVKNRVTTMHNMEPSLDFRGWQAAWAVRMFATQVVAVSQSVANYWIAKAGYNTNHVRVIYNSSGNTADRPSSMEKPTRPKRPFKIVNINRLAVQKGQVHLIRAIKSLVATYPDLQLDIYGDDYEGYGNELVRMISDLGMDKNISLKGPTTDVPAVLRKYDLFVNSSLWEGFGMVNIEAMEQGLPMVITDIPPHREIFNYDIREMFAAPGNPTELASAIACMMNNEELMRRVSRKNLVRSKDFSEEVMVGKYVQLYREFICST